MNADTPPRLCKRAYYSESITNFLQRSNEEILGHINLSDTFSQTLDTQRYSWNKEIDILKKELLGIKEGQILFEYSIPRMGKRVDVIILHQNIVFLLEFKCGDTEYRRSTYNQLYDYALDLRNFHKESHNKLLACIMVSDKAPASPCSISKVDNIIEPIPCNASNIRQAIDAICARATEQTFNYEEWEYSNYMPTPTIIEAAQALYNGHDVHDITRCDAGAYNLTVTSAAINRIIAHSKQHHRKSICFVTGVPGAGKTLVGLNIAIQHSNVQAEEHAVFLSGNQPLITVLQEALARDKVTQDKRKGIKTTLGAARKATSSFIQIIHQYRDFYIGNELLPPEHVAIFDEAQRAWKKDQLLPFITLKRRIEDFDYSEPEFLISTLDRHKSWAVMVCLIGGGQEINRGEAGMPEWFDSLRRRFKHWDVYVTPQLNDTEYRQNREWGDMISNLNIYENPSLHLATSLRSYRTPNTAAFVKALLDVNINQAKALYEEIKDKYPIVITRELNKAKNWVKNISKGTTRYGLLASSGGLRLKAEGIYSNNEFKIAEWFLADKDDVRSSYYLEETAKEFNIQGLELDYTLVAWDADFRFHKGEWTYNKFTGNKWQAIRSEEKRLYLKNAYRVLLTRARQGMVIFIPKGSEEDVTRNPEFYNEVYIYFKQIGISELY